MSIYWLAWVFRFFWLDCCLFSISRLLVLFCLVGFFRTFFSWLLFRLSNLFLFFCRHIIAFLRIIVFFSFLIFLLLLWQTFGLLLFLFWVCFNSIYFGRLLFLFWAGCWFRPWAWRRSWLLFMTGCLFILVRCFPIFYFAFWLWARIGRLFCLRPRFRASWSTRLTLFCGFWFAYIFNSFGFINFNSFLDDFGLAFFNHLLLFAPGFRIKLLLLTLFWILRWLRSLILIFSLHSFSLLFLLSTLAFTLTFSLIQYLHVCSWE